MSIEPNRKLEGDEEIALYMAARTELAKQTGELFSKSGNLSDRTMGLSARFAQLVFDSVGEYTHSAQAFSAGTDYACRVLRKEDVTENEITAMMEGWCRYEDQKMLEKIRYGA